MLKVIGGNLTFIPTNNQYVRGSSTYENIVDNLDIKSECSPNVDGSICSSKKSLNIMRKWLESEGIKPKNNNEIVEEAKKKTNCNSESCLYKPDKLGQFLPENDLKERFNPEGPWDNNNWLSNIDIDGVLDLYSKKFPKFYHVNFQMIDFQDYKGELTRVDFENLLQNYKYLACVLNTDTSKGKGKHWICIFIDMDGRTVEFFDSAASSTPDEILRFMVNTTDELNNHLKNKENKIFTERYINTLQHQKQNSECGVYCLFYILSRINNITPDVFEKNRITDEDMLLFRKYLFRNS